MEKLALLFFLFVPVFSLEIKQNSTGKPFELKCPPGQHVVAFGSTFLNKSDDHRSYRIDCQKLPISQKSAKCKLSDQTDLLKDFDNSGCSQDGYLTGIESSKFKSGDRRFRFVCCRSDKLIFGDCRTVETHPKESFRIKLNADEVIKNVSSNFVLESSRKNVLTDRKWRLVICKVDDKPALTTTTTTTKAASSTTTKSPNVCAPPEVGPEVIAQGLDTPAFKPFKTQCRDGQAIRSIRAIARNRDKVEDFSLNIDCIQLPYKDIPVCPVKRVSVPFAEENALREINSKQSLCDLSQGQFLCGISGTYDTKRKLSAICCTIEDVWPDKKIESILISVNDEGSALIGNKQQYIVNLDIIPGGSWVGHAVTFGRQYIQKGYAVSSSTGCRCKCPCQCPNAKQKARERRQSSECSNVECTCKCILTCDDTR